MRHIKRTTGLVMAALLMATALVAYVLYGRLHLVGNRLAWLSISDCEDSIKRRLLYPDTVKFNNYSLRRGTESDLSDLRGDFISGGLGYLGHDSPPTPASELAGLYVVDVKSTADTELGVRNLSSTCIYKNGVVGNVHTTGDKKPERIKFTPGMGE